MPPRRSTVVRFRPPGHHTQPDGAQPITLLDLTTHFSGLPMNPTNRAPVEMHENPYVGYTVSRMYEFLSSYELPRDPGDAIEYSNIGVALLGHALSLRARMTTYDALVYERILRPLGMTDTAVTLTPRMKAHLVRGHDRAGGSAANWDLSALAGMGGLSSTANDMLTFAAANLSPKDTDLTLAMRLAHRELRQAKGFAYPGIPIAFNEGRIGFNWFNSRPGERRITWTVGLTGGYSTFLGLDIEARRAVVVLTNTGLNNVDYLAFHLLDPTVPLPQARQPEAAR
jgi:CubicO group peptidase (beta-lactamase class C family)